MHEISRERVGTNAIQREGWEDGDYWCETTFYDEKSLEQNQKIKNSGMLHKGKLGLFDNADIRMAISIPSTMQFSIFRKKHHETYKLLTSKDEAEMVKGMRQISILEPDWIVYERI